MSESKKRPLDESLESKKDVKKQKKQQEKQQEKQREKQQEHKEEHKEHKEEQKHINVKGVVFVKKDVYGDFSWMVKQKEYENTLFLYNENFLASLENEPSKGEGSAAIRPLGYKFSEVPRAAGIPTGWSVLSDGFTNMDRFTRLAIDHSFEHVKLILRDHPNITHIIFSCSSKDHSRIGSNIFDIAEEVVSYISEKIQSLSTFDPTNLKEHAALERSDEAIRPFAEMHKRLALKDRIIIMQEKEIVRLKGAPVTGPRATGQRAFMQQPISRFFWFFSSIFFPCTLNSHYNSVKSTSFVWERGRFAHTFFVELELYCGMRM